MRAIIDVGLVSHHLTPALHGVVLELAPRIGVAQRTALVSRAVADAIEAALRRHADEIAPDIDLATAAAVIETVLEALAHRAVQEHPVHFDNERLAKEASRLIHSYLTVGG